MAADLDLTTGRTDRFFVTAYGSIRQANSPVPSRPVVGSAARDSSWPRQRIAWRSAVGRSPLPQLIAAREGQTDAERDEAAQTCMTCPRWLSTVRENQAIKLYGMEEQLSAVGHMMCQ
jgi:hypothetical protein